MKHHHRGPHYSAESHITCGKSRISHCVVTGRHAKNMSRMTSRHARTLPSTVLNLSNPVLNPQLRFCSFTRPTRQHAMRQLGRAITCRRSCHRIFLRVITVGLCDHRITKLRARTMNSCKHKARLPLRTPNFVPLLAVVERLTCMVGLPHIVGTA